MLTTIQWLTRQDNQILLLGVGGALVIGTLIGAWNRGRRRRKSAGLVKGDQAFLKGVQYILSNDHDQAIEEFTKSVQVNSDTIETYLALGNLYRTKGDIDRAIRIRQNILLRPHIDEQLKLRALFDLGLDYRKGGFLNRALEVLLQVSRQIPEDAETLKQIERIYEELKEWEKAYDIRQKIAKIADENHQNILAHHLVEIGKNLQAKGELNKAKANYQKALANDGSCVDAYLHLGDLYYDKKDYKKAIENWQKIALMAPQFTFLAYERLERIYPEMKNLKPAEEFLKQCVQSNSDPFTHLALARYLYNRNDPAGALTHIEAALKMEPNFWEARRVRGEIFLAQGKEEEALLDYREIIEHLKMPYFKFQCSQCGLRPNQLQWQCPQCRRWDTIKPIKTGVAESDSTAEGEKESASSLESQGVQ